MTSVEDGGVGSDAVEVPLLNVPTLAVTPLDFNDTRDDDVVLQSAIREGRWIRHRGSDVATEAAGSGQATGDVATEATQVSETAQAAGFPPVFVPPDHLAPFLSQMPPDITPPPQGDVATQATADWEIDPDVNWLVLNRVYTHVTQGHLVNVLGRLADSNPENLEDQMRAAGVEFYKPPWSARHRDR